MTAIIVQQFWFFEILLYFTHEEMLTQSRNKKVSLKLLPSWNVIAFDASL